MKTRSLLAVAILFSVPSYIVHASDSTFGGTIHFRGNIAPPTCSTINAIGTSHHDGNLSCWQEGKLIKKNVSMNFYADNASDIDLIKSLSHRKLSENASQYVISYN